MPTRLYFDLTAVTDQARHAILADDNHRTPQEEADNVAARPALRFFRHGGRVQLSSNGIRSGYDIVAGDAVTVYAQPNDALTTPVARPPDARNCAVLPLLNPDGQSLFDQLCHGLAAGCQWAMLDPQTLTLGVGRRRIRSTTRTRAASARAHLGRPPAVR